MAMNLVKEVQTSIESIQVDLKGVAEDQAGHFVEKAFKESRVLKAMIKVTLLVGAGKGDRAKYNDDLPKWVMNKLREIGYQEDRGASADFACSGTYKFQHDTGKNLKYVHVFPRATKALEDENEDGRATTLSTIAENRPDDITEAEWYILVSSLDSFKKIVEQKLPFWILKKRCTEFIKSIQAEIEAVEKKMANMKEITPKEHTIFTESQDLSEKLSFLTEEMKLMVDSSKLTKAEIDIVLAQIEQRLEKLQLALDNSKEKITIDKIHKSKENLDSRKERIADLKPFKHPFKGEKEFRTLCKKLVSLRKLAEKAGSKGLWSSKLTPNEVAELREKDDMEARLKTVMKNARYWFEEEGEFNARLIELKNSAATRVAQSSSKQPSPSNKTSSAGWQTVGKPKKKKIDFNKLQKKKPNTGSFNALMD